MDFFFLEYAPLSQLHDCIEWYHQELFKFYFFWGSQIFRITILRGFLNCLNECACRFQPWDIPESVDGHIEGNTVLFLFFAYSRLLSWPVVMKKLLKFLPKTTNPFSKFFKMFTVPWCSTPFYTIVVFWMILRKPIGASACWWPCWKCVCGSWGPEWNLKFSRRLQVLDMVLKSSSDINEGKWIHHSPTSLFWRTILHPYMKLVSFIYGSTFRRKFLVLHFRRSIHNRIPKPIRPRMDWFWRFLC